MDQPTVLHLRTHLGCPSPPSGTFSWGFIGTGAEQAGERQLGCAGVCLNANLPGPGLLQVSCQQMESGDLPVTTGSPPACHCHAQMGFHKCLCIPPAFPPLKEEQEDSRFCRDPLLQLRGQWPQLWAFLDHAGSSLLHSRAWQCGLLTCCLEVPFLRFFFCFPFTS